MAALIQLRAPLAKAPHSPQMQKQHSAEELLRFISGLKPFKGKSILLNEQHFYQNSILSDWAKKPPHPVTLRHLANFGRKVTPDKLLASANFVRTEIPIRLSLKIQELQNLPYYITNNYHINQVYQTYYHCFNAFRKVKKVETLEENQKFCEFVTNILDDHLIVLPHLMMGALEVSIMQSMSPNELNEFMSSMLRSRISRRVIMNQHISMSKTFAESQYSPPDEMTKPPDYIGEAFQYCSPHNHLKMSYDLIIKFLQSLYPELKMPDLVITGDDIKFQFLTNHLNYIFTEILRNSLKSTIEHFIKQNKGNPGYTQLKPPPVRVDITSNKYETAFKFSDQGGGIPFESIDSVWSFGKTPELAKIYLKNFNDLPGLNLPSRLPIVEKYFQSNTTNETDKPEQLTGVLGDIGQMELSSEANDRSMLTSLASRPFEYKLGISLPMCKVYTEYWNGVLDVSSVEGYGSDVYLRLQKLGNQDAVKMDKA